MTCDHKWTQRTVEHNTGTPQYPKYGTKTTKTCTVCGEQTVTITPGRSRYYGD